MDMNQPGGAPPVDQNDRIIAALSYPITIIVSLIILLTDMKNKPFLKYHAIQSLVVGVIVFVVSAILSVTVILACLAPVVWLVTLWPAYKAYQGEYYVIPVVTDFIKGQHWV